MSRVISYLLVSTNEQTVEAAGGKKIAKEFADDAVGGTTDATSRAGWSACMAYLRERDTPVGYAGQQIGGDNVCRLR